MGKRITTVSGNIAPESLGITSLHEHIETKLYLGKNEASMNSIKSIVANLQIYFKREFKRNLRKTAEKEAQQTNLQQK